MKRSLRSPLLLVALLLLLAGAGFAWRYHAARSAEGPDAARVDLRPSSEFMNVAASARYYRERLLREPEVVDHYAALAQLYLQQARTTADEATYLPKAERLLESALRRDPAHYHARVLKASLLNTLHRFDEALRLADALIAEHPDHAFTHGLRVDALVELGRYDEAVEACDRMLAIRPGLPAYSRAAYLRQLHGDLDGAIEAMTLAAEAGMAGRADRAWALHQLGQLYLQRDDRARARALFAGLLEERPGYAFALGGLGHLALLGGDPGEATRLLLAAYDAAPSDVFLELLAEVYALAGDEARHQEVLAQIEQGLRDAEAFGENVRLEQADFLAEQRRDLDAARRLVEAERARRPDHLHVLETHAWVLHRLGRPAEAIPLVERALRLGTQDALLHARAAQIYEAAGDAEKAHHHLQRALDLNLHVESPQAAAEARARL